MATKDRHRNTCPVETQVLAPLVETSTKKLLNRKGVRADGRVHDAARAMFARTGVVSHASGSCFLEMQSTRLICAVYGPRETLHQQKYNAEGRIQCEFRYAPFARANVTPGDGRTRQVSGTAEKDASAIIEKALHRSVRLEAFPKSQVDVYVTVLEEGGSALSCAITCASMALASAGLDMYDMVVGVQVMRLPDSLSTILVDPTLEEEKQAKVSALVAYMPALEEVSHVTVVGRGTPEAHGALVEGAVDACAPLYAAVHAVLLAPSRP